MQNCDKINNFYNCLIWILHISIAIIRIKRAFNYGELPEYGEITEYGEFPEYEEFPEYGEYHDSEFICKSPAQCVPYNKCLIDDSSEVPPNLCRSDSKTGQDLFCCKRIGVALPKPEPIYR